MLPKLRLQTFWIILLVLSSLWVVAVFGPLVYSVLSPTEDLSAIVRALQGREVPPSKAGTIVQLVLEQGGPLGRAFQVGHYADGSVILQNGASHTTTKVSDTYIAWFRKFPKPILMMVQRYDEDGVLQRYEIHSADSVSPLARAYALPVVALAVSIYLVRKRKSPMLSDPAF
jgi:hypothetical protein